MRNLRLPITVLLFGVCIATMAAAENQPNGGNSAEASNEMAEAILPGMAVTRVSLPDAPSVRKAKPKVIDKKFIAVMGSLAGAEAVRFTTHKLVLDNEYAAGAPWVTSVPKNGDLVVKYGAIYAGEFLVAYEMKKPHSWLPGDRFIQKLWWVAPAAMLPIHIKNGVRSIRTQPPADAGCSSVAQCEALYEQ